MLPMVLVAKAEVPSVDEATGMFLSMILYLEGGTVGHEKNTTLTMASQLSALMRAWEVHDEMRIAIFPGLDISVNDANLMPWKASERLANATKLNSILLVTRTWRIIHETQCTCLAASTELPWNLVSIGQTTLNVSLCIRTKRDLANQLITLILGYSFLKFHHTEQTM
jgi:hypothetical protein